jgi:hypothetical protein
MDGPKTVHQMYLGLVLKEFCGVVTTDPEELRPKPYDFPWELVIYVAIIGLLSVLLLLWRSFESTRSRFYTRREKHLAMKLSGLIEEKCKLLEKLSLLQKQHDALESSLKDTAYTKLEISKLKLEEVLLLGNQLIEEKSKHCKQVELNEEMSKMIHSLEDESKLLKSKVAKANITLRILQINEAHLKDSTTDVLKENAKLQESCKQLL